MDDKRNDRLVWLDMEMTGLDPETCVPIQVAMVITSGELEEIDALELTIWQPDALLVRMEPFVRNMHTENGLLHEVRQSETSLMIAERNMMRVLTRWCDYGSGILAGNSIHMDRAFLRAYFPAFEGFLHYRMIDVSSIKELAQRWYGPKGLYSKGKGKHTALADIRESIAELKHYRKTVFKPNLDA